MAFLLAYVEWSVLSCHGISTVDVSSFHHHEEEFDWVGYSTRIIHVVFVRTVQYILYDTLLTLLAYLILSASIYLYQE